MPPLPSAEHLWLDRFGASFHPVKPQSPHHFHQSQPQQTQNPPFVLLFPRQEEDQAQVRDDFFQQLHRGGQFSQESRLQDRALEDLENRSLRSLLDAFPRVSLEHVASAFTLANGDPNLAAELLSLRDEECQRNTSQHRGFSTEGGRELETNAQFKRSSDVSAQFGLMPGDSNSQRMAGYVTSSGLSTGTANHRGKDPVGMDFAPQERICDGKATTLSSNFPRSEENFHPSCSVFSPSQIKTPASASSSGKPSYARVRGNGVFGAAEGVFFEDGWSSDGAEDPKKSQKTTNNDSQQMEAVEEFLISMLGESFEPGTGVVRDVIGHFGGDLQKSLDTLLNMATTTSSFKEDERSSNVEDDGIFEDPTFLLMEAFPDQDPVEVLKVLEDLNGDIELATDVLLGKETEMEPSSHGKLTTIHQDLKWDLRKQDSNMQYLKGDVEQATDALLEKETEMDPRSLGKLTIIHQDLEGDLCKEEDSNMQWAMDQLAIDFPSVDPNTLFVILETNNFNYSEAWKMLHEDGIGVGTNARKMVDHEELSKMVIQSLFKPKEDEKQDTCDPICETFDTSKESIDTVTRGFDSMPQSSKALLRESSHGGSDDYDHYRQSAKQHWKNMKLCYKEAAAAYAKGERAKAGTLSEKGVRFKQLANEANKRASNRLFHVKNQDIENDITIDLHAQHVGEALALLKLHLKSLAPIPSVHTLTVITGSGSHSAGGRPKIKSAVVQYLGRNGITWTELNPGRIVIKMNSVKLEKVND